MLSPSAILWRAFRKKVGRIHWPILLLTLGLTGIGIGMLYSAAGGEMLPWAQAHLTRGIMGLVGLILIMFINVRVLMNLAPFIFLGALALLGWVEVAGHIGMGAQRWINLGFMQIQPSEPAKLAVILMMAYYFHRLNPEHLGRLTILIPPAIILALPVVLILRQPNLGTATIICLIGGAILFGAGIRIWKFVVAGLAVAGAAPIAWSALHDYQKQRVMTFLNPESDPLGSGYNILQSKIAIGSGGMTGKGFLQGSQSQLDFLPEKQTDFVFTMLSEEFGFTGGAVIIGLYALLLMYAYLVALVSQNHFGRLVAYGVATYFFVHVFINVGMVMGLLPVVGVPLPFLSYGGTSLLTSFAAIGLLMNVHIHKDVVIPRISGM